MTVGQALFSFQGRMSRCDYWLKGFLLFLLPLGIISNILFFYGFGFNKEGAQVLYFIVCFVGIWPSLALAVKRLHDLNRSGWFYAIILIPFVNIWILIELLFLRGTIGPNRFGDDPVQVPA